MPPGRERWRTLEKTFILKFRGMSITKDDNFLPWNSTLLIYKRNVCSHLCFFSLTHFFSVVFTTLSLKKTWIYLNLKDLCFWISEKKANVWEVATEYITDRNNMYDYYYNEHFFRNIWFQLHSLCEMITGLLCNIISLGNIYFLRDKFKRLLICLFAKLCS